MADVDVPSENLVEGDPEIFGEDASKVKTLAVTLDGEVTDIVICNYSDRLFIVISQFQKIGTLISVTKGAPKNLNGSGEVYEVKTLSGLDSQEYHLAARFLAQQIDVNKPVLFGICMKDHRPKILKALVKVLLENKIW